MKMQSSLSPSTRLAIYSVRDQRISQHDSGVVQDRREDKNLINGIFPRKALLKKNLSVSPSENGVPVPARGRTSLLLRMQLVVVARLLYLVYPTSSRLSTIPSRLARRLPMGPPASQVFQVFWVFRVFRGWVHPMFIAAPRRRAYPRLHPWDHPVPAHKHRHNHKDKDKAVSLEEEEGRFLVKMICFGIIMSPVDLQIGIGMVEETEAGWIGIEIHEGGKTQEVIKCMVVDQGEGGGLLPDLRDKDQDRVKEDTITHLLLPTIPLTRPHLTRLLLPTTTTTTTITTTHLVIHQRPIMLCLLDQVVHLNIILIIGLHRDLLRMAQVDKGIMALPHLVGMASTAAAVAVGTVGMDGDKMKSISLDGR